VCDEGLVLKICTQRPKTKHYQMRLKLGITLLLASCTASQAAIFSASSAARDHVQAAVDKAVSGDTVKVPSGTVSWTSGVYIPDGKNITLQGGGIGKTVISQGLGTIINLGITSSRVTGFTFRRTSDVTDHIINASGVGWRVDNCRFEGSSTASTIGVRAFYAADSPGHPDGLVHNCQFWNAKVVAIGDNGSQVRDRLVWAAPLALGTDKAVYIEDCTFTLTRTGNVMDGAYGARYVFRYNDVTDGYIEAHGMQHNERRGIRKWEIYGNTIRQVNVSNFYWVYVRGGTGVIFNNNNIRASGGCVDIAVDVRRAVQKLSLGQDSMRDGNDPIPAQGTGTHTGSNGASTLTDSQRSWASGTLVSPGSGLAAFWIYNLTSGAKGQITANTATTITAALSGGSRSTWATGDKYKITGGSWSRDGIGRSKDAYLTSGSNWAPQELDPAYMWNNQRNGNLVGVSVRNGTEFWCRKGRDYFVNAGSKPGYTPFTYPHPLRAQEPIQVISSDTETPKATLSVQSSTSALSGTVVVKISATDNVSVSSTEFRVNGKAIARSSANPYQFNWDTTAHPDGDYAVRAAAIDSSGNTGLSAELKYKIVNTTPATRVVKAASVGRDHVQAAIDAAAPGDTVVVPAGIVTWSSGVSIPSGKDITLQGAGIGKTVVRQSTGTIISLGNTSSRLTGFTLTRAADVTDQIIHVAGAGWRLDNCRFEGSSSVHTMGVRAFYAPDSPGHPDGLIDNCQFWNAKVMAIGDNGAKLRDRLVWAEPLGLGTDKAIYVEDCTFTLTRNGNVMDSNFGARFVFRYNDVTDGYIEARGMEHNERRGTRKWEIYGNTIRKADLNQLFWIYLRGGSGVVFGNSFLAPQGDGSDYLAVDVRRAVQGLSLGQDSLRDGNEAISGGTGAHSGSNGATVLSDSTKKWTSNVLVSPGSGRGAFWIYNLTSGASAQITANTATTISAPLTGGSRQTWNTGDKYKVTGGSWSRDGIGRSKDAYVATSTSWAPQERDPAYFWSNTKNGVYIPVGVRNQCGFWCVKGRDYFDNAGPKPGYVPFTYPHPLRGEPPVLRMPEMLEPEPPQVTLNIDPDESVLSGTVMLEIAATDHESIVSTEFHCNGEVLLSSSDNPLRIAWDTTEFPDGPYLLQGAATDKSGNILFSDEYLCEVVNTPSSTPAAPDDRPRVDRTQPVVQILTPADRSQGSGNIVIKIEAHDDVALSQVELWINGVLMGTSDSSPAEFRWNFADGVRGENVITAIAFDSAGNWSYHMIRVHRR
jgi:hypothetical protein